MIILLVKYRVTDGINITYQSEEIMKFEKEDDICTDSIKKKCFSNQIHITEEQELYWTKLQEYNYDRSNNR